jgi:hypothetical protein
MDVALAGVPEDLDIAVFFAGGPRGAYRPMLTKQLSIQRGSLDSGQEITMASSLFAFKPQSRVVRTEDANNQAADPLAGSCGVERIDNDNVDESFQFLIVGHGPATIRWIRSFAYPVPEDTAGDGLACSDETRLNAVRFDGVAAAADDIGSLIAELSTATTQGFFSNQTQVLRNGDFSAVGVGSAESIVSQKAADRVATIVATQQAQAELDSVVPPVLSVGLGL